MRQQEHNAILPHPLCLSWADELVNNALCHVVEITKLSLPENQSIRASHGKAQLKAYSGQKRKNGMSGHQARDAEDLRWGGGVGVGLTQDTILRQRAVANSVGGLIGPKVVHGDTGSLVYILIMEHVVAMAEAE